MNNVLNYGEIEIEFSNHILEGLFPGISFHDDGLKQFPDTLLTFHLIDRFLEGFPQVNFCGNHFVIGFPAGKSEKRQPSALGFGSGEQDTYSISTALASGGIGTADLK